MKKIEDENFKKIWKLEKYKELFDYGTVETRTALFGSIFIIILSLILVYYNGGNQYAIFVQQLIKDIGMALIGFLGFVVTGLAILTGSISSKIVKFFKENGAYSDLEEILLSFYFIGFIIAVEICLNFFLYLVLQIDINCIWWGCIIGVAFLGYVFIFILFYSVGLIGNCLSMFSIISDVNNRVDKESENLKSVYDSYRIMALEYIILSRGDMEGVELYKKKVEEKIKNDKRTTDKQKERLIEIENKHFNK